MSDESTMLAPPRGMRDFYPPEMALRRRLFDVWHAAARRAGFEEYDACVVESLDLLKRKAGEEIVDQIYAFQDKSERWLALRPEMTPTLARMLAAREGSLTFPVKWYTIAQCFRYERMTRGRKREHYQWNLDIVGTDAVAAEAQVLGAAVDAMDALGLDARHYAVRFSSRALLGDLLASLGIAPAHHAPAFLALDKRGKIDDAAIERLLAAEGVDRDCTRRIFDLLSLDSLDAAAARLSADAPSLAGVRRFLEVAAAQGIGELLRFDLSVIRGLSYYTGIVFEAFDTAGKLRAIFGGGRYDRLLADVGGKPRSGVGLGFGDVVVAELLTDLALAGQAAGGADIEVGFMEPAQELPAIRAGAAWRREGKRVSVACQPEKAKVFFGRVSKSGAAEAVYIGPDDVAAGLLRVKNLATREQRDIPLRSVSD
jgi:histidyl-tRNA synthetase